MGVRIKAVRHLGAVAVCGAAGLLLAVAGSASAASVRLGRAPEIPSGARATGPLPAQTRIRLTVALAPRDPVALAAYASQVSTPGSPVYGHYLTVDEFAQRFGATAPQVAAVSASLRAHGLAPGPVSPNGLAIVVTPTAVRAARAFSTGLERYGLPGARSAFANTRAPALDSSVARLVQGVIGLNTLAVRKPLAVRRSSSSDVSPRPDVAPNVVTGGPEPCAQASAVSGAYTADQLASAYRFPPLYDDGDFGAGQTVALYELEPFEGSDVTGYQSCYGTSSSVTNVPVDGGAGTGFGGGESALDIEDVIGLAPRANIRVYTGPNTNVGAFDTYSAIITEDRAKVISTSWLLCEPELVRIDPGEIAAENILFQEAATQGQSIVAASGDHGAEGCAAGDRAASDPAAQPFITGVGGTTLNSLGPPPGETVWNNASGATGGGISELWTMPSYQTGAPASLGVIGPDASKTVCGSTTTFCREVPDVSADADPFTGYVIFFQGSWGAIGGTSAAAPLWAALLALANASPACAGIPVGFANPALYRIAGGSFASNFYDVTSGDNQFNRFGGFVARAGYDMTTGLGSPNGAMLAGALCDRVTVTSPGDQSSIVGAATSVRVSATSSVGSAVSFSATGLPAGLSIDPASGVISGAPASPGASTINVQARDGDGAAGGASFQWIVRDATVTLAAIPNQSGDVGTPVTLRLRATVDNGRLPGYSATGLPPGVSVAPATGIVSGVPTEAGRFKVTATATDASGASAHTVFRWAIVHPLRSTRAGLTAVGRHHPKLAFTLSAIDRAAAIKTVSIAPPRGLSFAAHRRGIAVAVSRGTHVRFTTAVRHGVLTLKLSKAVNTLRVIVGGPSLRVSGALARRVASRRAKLLTVAVTAADGQGLGSRLTFRVRPH